MKVVFFKDHGVQGKKWEVKDVKDGFARNFLIPQGIALPAVPQNLKRIDEEKKKIESRKRKKASQAHEICEALRKVSLTIASKAGQEDKLFGAVTAEDIVKALQEQANIEVDKHALVLEQPLKKLGIYKIPVRLSEDVEGELKVWVVGEK